MPDVQPDDRLAVAAVCTRIMPGTPRGEIAVGFERARSAGAASDETATTTT